VSSRPSSPSDSTAPDRKPYDAASEVVVILEGAKLMAVGMTTVFAFLLLMVAMIHSNAWLVRRLGHEDVPAPPRNDESDDLTHIAIALAVIESQRRQA